MNTLTIGSRAPGVSLPELDGRLVQLADFRGIKTLNEENVMHTIVHIDDKPVTVELSRKALDALARRETPLLAEMELLFSCLIRKKVRFLDAADSPGAVPVIDGLALRFHPVMTAVCHVADLGDNAPPLADFPITNPRAFIPHWLRIDYDGARWHGEFGYRH